MSNEPEPLSASRSAARSFVISVTPYRYFPACGGASAVYSLILLIVDIVQAGEITHIHVLQLFWLPPLCALLGIAAGMVAFLLGQVILAVLMLPIDHVRYVTFTSGFVGFFPVILLIASEPSGITLRSYQFALVPFLKGSCLITTLFQFAGAWSEWPRREKSPSPAPWQFATSQLLKLTLSAALILTLLKLTGRLNAWAAIWTTLWVFYQAVSMWGVLRLLGWLYRGKAVLEGGGGDRGGMWG